MHTQTTTREELTPARQYDEAPLVIGVALAVASAVAAVVLVIALLFSCLPQAGAAYGATPDNPVVLYDHWIGSGSGAIQLIIVDHGSWLSWNSYGVSFYDGSSGPTSLGTVVPEGSRFYVGAGNGWSRQPAEMVICWQLDGSNTGLAPGYEQSADYAVAVIQGGQTTRLVGYDTHAVQYVYRRAVADASTPASCLSTVFT